MFHDSNKPKTTPFCKVCKDSGKIESEYISHWVKDLNGKVVCPTLLALVCHVCGKNGHTKTYCSMYINQQKYQAKEARRIAYEAKQNEKHNQPDIPKPVDNIFGALDESDESDNESDEDSTNYEIGEATLKSIVGAANRWIEFREQNRTSVATQSAAPAAPKESNLDLWYRFRRENKKDSWADEDDSDEEEEQFEEWKLAQNV